MTTELDLRGPLPTGRLVIEASAGTGKTYSLSALVVRHIAERGLETSALLVVTFTRAAAAELRDRTRRALVDALDAFDAGAAPAGHPWMQVLLDPDPTERRVRRERIALAIATFDDATVTTIHGFCQQALRQLGLRSGTALNSELSDSTALLVDEVCRDLVISALVHQPDALNWSNTSIDADSVLSSLREAVTALLGNPGAVSMPDPLTAVPGKHDTSERLASWVALVHAAATEVGRRRRVRQELGYDDLITGLRDAVCHPIDGPAVVAALNSRHQLVLVDEFQDTDPVQWQIFETAFTGDLVTVGDPKQAIYRFRGADVHAYLAATEGHDAVHLGTNFRSDADLVAATNSLVSDVEFGDQRIVGSPVRPAPSAAPRALAPGAPLVVRRVPDDERLHNSKGVAVPLARRVVLGDLVQVVIDLFENHSLAGSDGSTPVNPGHVAVLVPSHSTASEVVRALDRAGIPAVRTRTGSVFDTPAAAEWSLLLAALERPSHPPTARAAGLGVFLHYHPADLDPQADGAEQRLAELQQRCARWAELLAGRPLLAWYDHIRADSDLVCTLLATPGGERHLTDVDHIAELLAAELGGAGTTAASARRCLERLRASASDADDLGPQMRRIDSDAQAVQITTLHGSKGLEYPIVLLPFLWQLPKSQGPWIYNDPAGRRIIDIATGQGWNGTDPDSSEKGRRYHRDVGQRGDQLRLLYVGLTRAKHRTVVWWAPTPDSAKSALNTVLFDRDPAGAPLQSRPALGSGARGAVKPFIPSVRPTDDGDAVARLALLAGGSGDLIDVGECAVDAPAASWSPAARLDAPPLLAVAPAGDRIVVDPAWRRWSFTSITNTLGDTWSPSAAPVVGGADEPEDHTEHTTGLASPSTDMPWADVLAGAAFGTLVHEVLERIDPTSTTLEAHLGDAVAVQLRRDRLAVDPDVLVAGLAASLRTPLGPITGGLRLADIGAGDRLAELVFDLPLTDTHRRVGAAQIGEVLLATLPADDPQRPYAQLLADGRFGIDLAGYLQGSIDAVLRVPGTHGPRFVVVDYKTNRLHGRGAAHPLDAYHPDVLPAAMAHHDYPLQSLLYSVALHRYLRWRLPGYRPADHLGGIAYLFLRGMVGPHTPAPAGHPHGVFSWRPPVATIEALDRLLATGVVS